MNKNDKKKVLFCEAGHHGGSVNRLLNFFNKLDSDNIEPMLFLYFKNGKAGELLSLPKSIPKTHLGLTTDPPPDPLKKIGQISYPSLFGIRYFLKSLKFIRSYRPNLIYLNNTPFCQLPMIFAARLYRIPMICHMRDSIILTISERIALNWMTKVVVLSKAAKVFYGKQGVESEKMIVIYNGISLSDFDSFINVKPPRLPENRIIVTLVGTLISRKKQKLAINVIERLIDDFPNLLLLLLGDGPDRTEIEKIIQEKKLNNNVLLNGWTDNVGAYLAKSDVGLMLSNREGMPNVVIEYMAASLPLVVTNLPGIDEMVTDGYNGYVADIDDIDKIESCLRVLLNNNALREEMGRRGRRMLESGLLSIKKEHRDLIDLIMGIA